MPPIRKSATSAASAVSTHSRGRRRGGDADLALVEDVLADPVLGLGLERAPRRAAASAWNTSTPRSRITSQNASCSAFARLTHSTSSNSSSSAFDGVSRVCSRPGRWTMTLRSLPTSEWTPNAIIASSLVASRPFSDSAASERSRTAPHPDTFASSLALPGERGGKGARPHGCFTGTRGRRRRSRQRPRAEHGVRPQRGDRADRRQHHRRRDLQPADVARGLRPDQPGLDGADDRRRARAGAAVRGAVAATAGRRRAVRVRAGGVRQPASASRTRGRTGSPRGRATPRSRSAGCCTSSTSSTRTTTS